MGFLLSAIGVAVGTGNIWRFPRILAQNGSEDGAGAFIVAWIAFLLLWSVPLIIAEYLMGRKARSGAPGSFARHSDGKLTWMGAFVGFVTIAIMFYYAVVVGWVLFYFLHTVSSPLPLSTEEAFATWNGFQESSWPFLFHAVVLGIGALAVWRGIPAIERINKVLMPTLLIIVIGSAIRALTLPGSSAGLSFIFTPDWSQLGDPRIWLEALTQNAWDTGAGWGLFLTYAAYIKREHGLVKNAFLTGIGNNLVSLFAAVMIFGTVFSVLHHEMSMADAEILEIVKTSGPGSTGLTFIWMPQLFARMAFGHPLAAVFFLGLCFAGFTSLIAMLEVGTRILIDFGLTRKRAILSLYVLGIPSAADLNILGNQDFVWGVALMISGAFVAIVVIRYGLNALKQEELLTDGSDWPLGAWWNYVIMYFVPLAAVVLLSWWLYLSATEYAPETWYDPFDYYSVMTCLVQWAIAMVLMFVMNARFNRTLKNVD
jgi:NSS family neurotransmitter:Na+ symporter